MDIYKRLLSWLTYAAVLATLNTVAFAADYPANIDYGSRGDFIVKRGVTHGRTTNLTPIGPVLINLPEAPGSSASGNITPQFYNTAWDLSDLLNPIGLQISNGLTQPVDAHGTTYRFDGNQAYIYTRGTEVNGVNGDYLGFDPTGNTLVDQLISQEGYQFNERYQDYGVADEVLGYAMLTSPYTARTYWDYGFDPSGPYYIKDPANRDFNDPQPWLGTSYVEWDHLGPTGVTGFPTFLGELLIVASDQQSTGLAIYEASGVKNGQLPRLISIYQPTLTEPDGNEVGIGGYWMEPYGANKIVWAARRRGSTPLRTHPAMFVVDFTDPVNPVLTCELYFDTDASDPIDGDGSSDPMYVNFQDQYAYVDHFKVDIEGCEQAYSDGSISDTEFDQIVFKFDDIAHSCDGSQYFRPLGQVGVFGGYDWWQTAAALSYSSGNMVEGLTYVILAEAQAWVASGFDNALFPTTSTAMRHIETGIISVSNSNFSVGDEIISFPDFWQDLTATITVTDITVDERINEQGMCFFVTSDDADTTAPYISGHRPQANQTNFPVGGFISLHIPETLRVETVANAVTVTNLGTGQPISFRQQLSHTGTLSLWPDQPLDLNVSYQVDVAGIQDYMGNTMTPYSFTFTTGDQEVYPTYVPPSVIATSVENPYYPNHSGNIACHVGEDRDWVWVVNPDNDTISFIETVTDSSTFETTTEISESHIRRDGKPSSVTKIGDWLAVTFSDGDRIRFYRLGWWGTSTSAAWQIGLDYGDRPVASVAHGDMLYVALYGSGEVIKIDTASQQIVGRLAVGSKPKAMALTSDGSRLLVTRFISTENYAEVYDINTAGGLSFRDSAQPSIQINKVLVPDDIDHGSGVPNYLRSIVIAPDDDVAYVTANKANIDRGQLLSGEPLDDDNTIRPMIAIIDLVNHQDINTDPTTRAGTIDLDNAADPSGITFLPDGVTRVHALQGNNVIEMNNLSSNTIMRVNSGSAPQSMCTTLRNIYVKNRTDRTITLIDTSRFMAFGSQNPSIQNVVSVLPENEAKTADELRGLQVFYHARTPDISPEGYISCASCHDDGGHDGMTWDLTHMGEGLRNTISLRGTSGTRFGNLHWSSNFDEVQDFEAQLEGLNGADGLIAGATFSAGVSPLTHVTAGTSEDLDALDAYISGLGKETVLKSPNSCRWGGVCDPIMHNGGWQFHAHGCKSCHTPPAFRDGLSHDMGTITASSGQRLGLPLTEIRTPTLVNLWETAPYLHDGSAATLEEVLTTGAHANMGLDDRERTNLIQYLLNIDRLNFIGDSEPFNP